MQNGARPLCAWNNIPLIDFPVATRIGEPRSALPKRPGYLNLAPGRDHRNQKDIEGERDEIFLRHRAAGKLSREEHFPR